MIVDYLDEHQERFGVEPVCAVLKDAGVQIAPSTYYAAKTRPPSARSTSDVTTTTLIEQVHADNFGVYGVRKIHAELHRRGHLVARCTVARLMRAAGLVGCHRRRRRGLTRQDPTATPAPDLVGRLFDPGAPDRTWFADISHVPTGQGWLYLAAVLDGCSRRVVGWAMAEHLRAELAIDALQMALERRQPAAGLICHSDRGSQYTAGVYTRALEAAGARQSMGRVATCFDTQSSIGCEDAVPGLARVSSGSERAGLGVGCWGMMRVNVASGPDSSFDWPAWVPKR